MLDAGEGHFRILWLEVPSDRQRDRLAVCGVEDLLRVPLAVDLAGQLDFGISRTVQFLDLVEVRRAGRGRLAGDLEHAAERDDVRREPAHPEHRLPVAGVDGLGVRIPTLVCNTDDIGDCSILRFEPLCRDRYPASVVLAAVGQVQR
ncbi:hypothetical protein [Halomicrobium katesii]|uniref:hypothetical protein n=1 Tax=Halomicrobium katesii TaxID=437163 RepID=UPI000381A36A|nr:hypothetical protein [Halomicrobium katesii]